MDINKRINQLIDYLYNGNVTDFSSRIGIDNNVTLNKIKNGKNAPSYKVINAILTNISEINAEWLMRGEGTMFRKGTGEIEEDQTGVEVSEGDVRYLKQIIKQQEEMIGALKDHIATLKKEHYCSDGKKSKAG